MPKIPVAIPSHELVSVPSPQPEELPVGVRTFRFHGLPLEWEKGGTDAVGDCPFCHREGKFGVNLKTGQWQCFPCGESGNPLTFLRKLWEMSDKQTKSTALDLLAKDRGFLFPETLIPWELVQSAITGKWLVPEYGADGKLCCLSKWVMGPKGKVVLYASPKVCGINHGMFGMQIYKKDAKDLWILEGWSDPISLYEVLRITKQDDEGKVSITGAEGSSLYHDASVIGIPGVNTFKEQWLLLAAGKRVFLCFDNDYPKQDPETKREKGLQGYLGMKKLAGMLLNSSTPPEEINYLCWGEKGYDPAFKDGYDVRDFFSQGKTPNDRVSLVPHLLGKIRPIPMDWGTLPKKGEHRQAGLEPLPCTSWEVLRAAYEKALLWHDGLDVALSVVLAVVASTGFPCDQLWLQLISPVSSGKGEIIAGLVANEKWCKEVGTFTGFHSGFQSDGEGKEDHSLIALIKNMTFIIKEGDTLLKATNREKILSQLREAYDKYCSTSYGNKVKRDYKDHPFTSIICGTDSMYELDASELGARYVNLSILEEIEPEMETQINLKKFNQIWQNKGAHVNGDGKSGDTPEKIYARRLCAGYVQHLRENAEELRAGVHCDPNLGDRLDRLVTFIAMMRARPAKKQNESEGRELSARLMGQFTALAVHLPIAISRKAVDTEVMRRIVKVVMCTARGSTFKLATWLYYSGQEGADTTALSVWLNQEEGATGKLLRFLSSKKLGVTERYKPTEGVTRRWKWRLTERFRELYKEVALHSDAPKK